MKKHISLKWEILWSSNLTLFRETFSGLITDGGGGGVAKKAPLLKICHTNPEMMKFVTLIPYLKKIQKIFESCDTPFHFYWH